MWRAVRHLLVAVQQIRTRAPARFADKFQSLRANDADREPSTSGLFDRTIGISSRSIRERSASWIHREVGACARRLGCVCGLHWPSNYSINFIYIVNVKGAYSRQMVHQCCSCSNARRS